jgi:hypothetical protein
MDDYCAEARRFEPRAGKRENCARKHHVSAAAPVPRYLSLHSLRVMT